MKFPKLNPFHKKGPAEMVGISFTANNIKVAHLKFSQGKAEITGLASRNIAGMADGDVYKIINGAINDLKAKSPEIINTIPSNLAITKNIEIPSTNPKEISDIISLQAGRHTPYSREEILIDHLDIGTYKHSYTKVLLIIVSRGVVKKQFDLVERAGFEVRKVLFAPESLAWYAANILKLNTILAPAGVVHIDDNVTDFTVVFKNKVIFIRSIPIGAQGLLEERERYEMRFTEELKRSVEAYNNENIEASPNGLLLTGAVEEMRDMEVILKAALNLPVKVMPYLKNLSISEEALRSASSAKRMSFLNVIAPLLAQEMKADLIPEEVKLRRAFQERGKDLIKTGILILASFVLICCLLISRIYFKGAYLKKLDERYGALAAEAEVLEKSYAEVSLIRNYLSSRGYSIDILAELHAVSPVDLELNNIRYDEQGKLSIRGTAESMSTVFSFVDNMEKSKYFKDVKTRYTSKRKEGARDVTDFEIVTSLDKATGQ